MRRVAGTLALAGLAVGWSATFPGPTLSAEFSHARMPVAAGAPGCPAVTPPSTVAGEPGSVPDTVSSETTVSEQPAWMTIEIVDVCGEPFTLAGFAGRPVFVELFATWCHNCAEQLPRTEEAAAELGADAVFVVLSVETDIDSGDVADYAEDRGFVSMRFAVMSPELLAALVDAFGNTAANPPSVPHFVISADGTPGELVTGSESADEIVNSLRTAGAGGAAPATSTP